MWVLRDHARVSGLNLGGQVGAKVAGALSLTPCPSQLDSLIHRFITLLADTSDSRAAESRVADASMACRKLAVAHPLLLLRYRLAIWPGVSPPPARGRPHTWRSYKNGLCGGKVAEAYTPVILRAVRAGGCLLTSQAWGAGPGGSVDRASAACGWSGSQRMRPLRGGAGGRPRAGGSCLAADTCP